MQAQLGSKFQKASDVEDSVEEDPGLNIVKTAQLSNGLSRTFLSFRARLAAIAFIKVSSYGSCAKSKNQGVDNVSRTFLSFRARLAAIEFLKPIFRFSCKKLFRQNSLKKLRNYVSYGSCGEKH